MLHTEESDRRRSVSMHLAHERGCFDKIDQREKGQKTSLTMQKFYASEDPRVTELAEIHCRANAKRKAEGRYGHSEKTRKLLVVSNHLAYLRDPSLRRCCVRGGKTTASRYRGVPRLALGEATKKAWASYSEEERNERVRRAKAGAGRRGPNRSESRLLGILEALGLPYAYNGSGEILIVGGAAADFVNVDGQKKVIELFGDYWHRGDDPLLRIAHFTKFGFGCLVLWEHELRDSNRVEQKLLAFEARRV